jgi:hypothetical protein
MVVVVQSGTHKVAGGSSFISGHDGCDAITEDGKATGQSIHFSGKYFTNTLMIDGAGYQWTSSRQSLYNMPSKVDGEVYSSGYGNSGDGYARITLLSADEIEFPISNIITNKGTFSREFSPDNTTYYVELDSEDINVDVSLELTDENVIVEDGSEGTVTISSGKYEHKIKVIGTDGTEYEYTLIFVREPSSYQYLEEITIDGVLIDGFSPEKLKYEIELPYDTKDTISVDAKKARPDQEIDGIDIYDVDYNAKIITLSVVSEDKQTTTKYTISVKKQDTTKLKYCEIKNQSFANVFKSDTYKYEFEVTTGVISLDIDAVPYDSDAKVTIKGAGYIKEGRNQVTITVSKDGIESTVYTIYVIKGENLGEVAYDFDYTGDYQVFVAPAVGYYKFECWGAQGYGGTNTGKGGYTSGVLKLNEGDTFYIYVGGQSAYGGWNGGGQTTYGNGGGGATDIRLISGEWNNTTSLISRIMVAGGGGGHYNEGGAGGGLTGYTGYAHPIVSYRGYGGTQTSGGSGSKQAGGFGYGGTNGKHTDGHVGGSGRRWLLWWWWFYLALWRWWWFIIHLRS